MFMDDTEECLCSLDLGLGGYLCCAAGLGFGICNGAEPERGDLALSRLDLELRRGDDRPEDELDCSRRGAAIASTYTLVWLVVVVEPCNAAVRCERTH